MTITATHEAVECLGGNSFPRLESPSLRLAKYACIGGDGQKTEAVNDVVRTAAKHQRPDCAFRFSSLPGAATAVLALQSRLIVNQAGGILENAGLCLHRHFGFPIIPGSAVKGVARHHAWTVWHEAVQHGNAAEARMAALKLALTFGYPTGDPQGKTPRMCLDPFLRQEWPDLFGPGGTLSTLAGSIVFLPAQPVGKALLVTDIVTCHHPKYYGSDEQSRATDDEPPNPQAFPAVETGTAFEFTVLPARKAGAPPARAAADIPDFNPVEYALHCLREAVEDRGIGAKTSAG